MFYRKADKIKALEKELETLKSEVGRQKYLVIDAQTNRDFYLERYNTLERTRPRTLDEQLVEARRIQKELQNQRTLTYLLEANEKMQKENS